MVIAQSLQKQELLPLVCKAFQILFNLKVNNSKRYQLLKISICIELYFPQACSKLETPSKSRLAARPSSPLRGRAAPQGAFKA